MSLPAVRLVQDFQRNIMFLTSQSWDIVSMLCLWARHSTFELVRAHFSKRGILKVCKAFLSRICHVVVFT